MSEKKDEFKEWVVNTFDEEAEQELRRLQEKEDELQVPEGVKEAVFARLQEQRKERNERDASRQPDEEDDDILSQLSPEDREALELGRKMMKAEIGRDENGNEKPRRRKKPVKIYLVLAAVIICVMAMGITSIGGPERVVRMVRQAVGDRDVEQVDSSEDNKIIEGEDEEKAYQKIEDTFDTEVVKITWKPDQMNFKSLEMDKENQVAEVYYNSKSTMMAYLINLSYNTNSWAIDIEDKTTKEYEKKINDCVVSIKEYKIKDNKNYKYTAKFKYKNIEYFLIATVDSKEFEEILNNLIFPK